MFSYFAYGVAIESALELPELVPKKAPKQVLIRLGEVVRLPAETINAEGRFRVTSDEVGFFWEGIGAFLICGGREIIIEPAPNVEERVLRLFILGRMLALLLHQRGLLVLHASAVAVAGKVVAFVGEKGWGKSTTAAALHARGHIIVADDAVVLDPDRARAPQVFPGFPQLKLWPEAAAVLGDDPATLPRLHPQFEKRARLVTDGFSPIPLPLTRIYVLAEGDSLQLEALRPQEGFLELLRHSSAVRLLEAMGTARSHFRRCAWLANTVSICRLRRPRSLPMLPLVTKLVENDLARIGREGHG